MLADVLHCAIVPTFQTSQDQPVRVHTIHAPIAVESIKCELSMKLANSPFTSERSKQKQNFGEFKILLFLETLPTLGLKRWPAAWFAEFGNAFAMLLKLLALDPRARNGFKTVLKLFRLLLTLHI